MVSKRGFTLIELLVVIAIIALLMAIIVPALKNAKELASGSVCLGNQKNLALAWTNYSGDYDSYLVGGSNYYSGTRATPYRWVEYPLMSDKHNPEQTAPATEAQYSLETRKNGIRAGRLFPYTEDEELYHCPGDKNYTKPEPAAVYRSYAITGLMNGEDFISRSGGIRTPINQYRTASVLGNKTLYVAVKMSDIVSPGNKHVFIEEDVSAKGQNVNAGGFVLLNPWWWDWPAYYHNDSSTIGFADGHAERHRWQNLNTLKLMRGEITSDPDAANNQDLKWLISGYLPMR
jgi:prepilin-type N-terminal cleavage/methylation domain-containing protein/prepilin-type processing-associated H-X9-DG protein